MPFLWYAFHSQEDENCWEFVHALTTNCTTQEMPLSVGFRGILTNFLEKMEMILEGYWKNLDDANRQLSLRFEKLKKTRATGDEQGIRMAEMDYFQALHHLYTEVQDAIAAKELSN